MGICLDTEQHNGSQELRDSEGRSAWSSDRTGAGAAGRSGAAVSTPLAGKFPMQNNSHVKFETPKVPVIFVLGGPGSGKVTHCDNLMQEKKGVVHINMTDLLQQYAIGNDMQDFGTLSSKTVTEVLMLEMKMAPAAKTYLVSGYPRSMRDVAEYSDKIQVVNGVILVSWRQKVLERQIEYGARLGHVVLSLARMELTNFYKNVMPVADYFDQSNMLIAVNGERNPGEVYKDFRTAVLKVLGAQENPSAAANGVTGAGADGIPGEIVGVDPAPMMPPAVQAMPNIMPRVDSQHVVQAEVITVKAADMEAGYDTSAKSTPPAALWVIGGPGSNKAALCQRAATQLPGWVHVSVGRNLRLSAEGGDLRPGSDASITRQSISGGEMVPHAIVLKMLQERMVALSGAKGLIIDGFPRDVEQAHAFERQFHQKPPVILLDCSKLQLGRGRLDDSVAAFRRRLELFRELSLPMLKALDADQRLTIIDGDTDTVPVQEEFNRVMMQHMQEAQVPQPPSKVSGSNPAPSRNLATATRIPKMPSGMGTTAAGSTAAPAFPGISTISQQVQNAAAAITPAATNGVKHMANGLSNGHANGYVTGVANGFSGMAAGKVAPMQANVGNMRNMYQGGLDRLDSHM